MAVVGIAKTIVKRSMLLVLMLLSLAAFGQDEGTYRLQIQDMVRIQIYNEPQVNHQLTIGRDGNISAPFVGIIRAAGKTTSELEAELAKEYQARLHLRDPKVSVTIEVYRSIRASIVGMVKSPGVYDMRPGDTVMTLVARGAGYDQDRADLRRATLRKANSMEVIPLDLYSMYIKNDLSQNYVIQDGDEIVVPEETRNRVLVMGAIQRPGPFIYKEPMYLADAISIAGGPIPIRSKLSQVLIVREIPGNPGQYSRIQANYVRFIRNGDNAQNVLLQPGDLIYVSETKTPDLNQIGAALNTLFIFDRFLSDGFLGLDFLRKK